MSTKVQLRPDFVAERLGSLLFGARTRGSNLRVRSITERSEDVDRMAGFRIAGDEDGDEHINGIHTVHSDVRA